MIVCDRALTREWIEGPPLHTGRIFKLLGKVIAPRQWRLKGAPLSAQTHGIGLHPLGNQVGLASR
ncbi:MAG TPA: hypothetical protein DIS71_01055 [Rhodobacter sp.]|jgi:hypothetical protein|nr:hypothetical protein [Rhodobacter sp.]